MGTGGDPTGLGRWTWSRIRGKGGMVFRYASVYCPCENRSGKIAVWTQQKTYLQNNNDDREPRKAFMQDLKEHIKKWIEGGAPETAVGAVRQASRNGIFMELQSASYESVTHLRCLSRHCARIESF